MPKLTIEEIRKRFELSTEFNEIFDAFRQAIVHGIKDMELYRQLFWNHTLTPDEVCLFGEKLAKEFPDLAYDAHMWLANVFEVTYSMFDNHELALTYYKKAAVVRPHELEPYLLAAESYEPDLNIPPASTLVAFLKEGNGKVKNPAPLYERLSFLYEVQGNDEMSEFYRRKTQEHLPGTQEPPPAP